MLTADEELLGDDTGERRSGTGTPSDGSGEGTGEGCEGSCGEATGEGEAEGGMTRGDWGGGWGKGLMPRVSSESDK